MIYIHKYTCTEVCIDLRSQFICKPKTFSMQWHLHIFVCKITRLVRFESIRFILLLLSFLFLECHSICINTLELHRLPSAIFKLNHVQLHFHMTSMLITMTRCRSSACMDPMQYVICQSQMHSTHNFHCYAEKKTTILINSTKKSK